MVDHKRLFEVKSATISNFNELWTANFKSNRSLIARYPGVTSLFEKFVDVPAVVVGAGPSLDKNIRWLAPAQDHALIIAVDTILGALEKTGVRPTIAVSLDPQPDIAMMFEGVASSGIPLVAPTIAHPSVLEAWKGELVFYNKFAPDIPRLVEIGQSNPDTGYLIPGGSVLSIGLDLAFRMGANPIAFIGQDLSYPKGSAYSKNTIYGDAGYEQLLKEKLGDMVTDTDIFGQETPTQKSLFVTKQWMEWAFTTWKRKNKADFYNCTEGGIVTKHCQITTFEEWVMKFCKEKKNFKWAIQKALKRKKR
ncbi:Motility accessory factor [hydrothermal vent metagenome]|uniref:Motility accessory factor n=1 Tax=hydrothermal vent metagenome TaxID=652676 RepID=A0A3B1B973_9ZZZZ